MTVNHCRLLKINSNILSKRGVPLLPWISPWIRHWYTSLAHAHRRYISKLESKYCMLLITIKTFANCKYCNKGPHTQLAYKGKCAAHNLGLQKSLDAFFKDCLFSNIPHITLHPTTYLMIPLESQNQTCNTSREWHKEHDTPRKKTAVFGEVRVQRNEYPNLIKWSHTTCQMMRNVSGNKSIRSLECRKLQCKYSSQFSRHFQAQKP